MQSLMPEDECTGSSLAMFLCDVGFLELNISPIVYSDTGIWMQTIYQTTPQGQFDPWIG